MQWIRTILKPTTFSRLLFFIFFDTLLFALSLFWAFMLRFNFEMPQAYFEIFWKIFFLLSFLKILFLILFKTYYASWRFFSLYEAKRMVYAHVLALISFYLIYLLFPQSISPMPRSVLLIDFFISVGLIGFFRFSKRLIRSSKESQSSVPTLLIGSDREAHQLLQSTQENLSDSRIVVIADDTTHNMGAYLHHLKITPLSDLEKLVKQYEIKRVIVAKKFKQKALNTLFERLNRLGINDIKRFMLLGDKEQIKELSIEDLLARRPRDLDRKQIAAFLAEKTVLITGAGGSIGSELARQCQRFGAKRLVLIDHSEFNLYQISEDLPEAEVKLFSILDGAALQACFEAYSIDLVLHAAAYKHVPLCEANVESAVQNNVQGTINVIDTAIAYRVPKLVIISTDKAVRPTNIMGATKRVTELYAQNVDAKETEISAVRFGNVLGSSGSVIPKFRAQIKAGGPVTVTHPEIERYFMLIPEACQLVLQAAAIANGGELFVLDMGSAVKISDLARRMIALSGKEDEIDIVYTGLRPGEKLYEELLLEGEEQATAYPSIYIAKVSPFDISKLKQMIATLLASDQKSAQLQKIVPEFKPKGV